MTTFDDLEVAGELRDGLAPSEDGVQSPQEDDPSFENSKFFKPWLNVDSRMDLQRRHQFYSSEQDIKSLSKDRPSGLGPQSRDKNISDGFAYDLGVNTMPYLDHSSHGCVDARLSSDDSVSSVIFSNNALNKRLFTCPYCRYLTDRKNNLKRHVITMHRKCDRTLECCGLVFTSKAALRDHVMVFHNAGYSCRFCSRNFCRKALLKRHLAVHSGRKDFTCDHCDYATSHKSNLDRHKKIHERVDKSSESLSPTSEMQLRRNSSEDANIMECDQKILSNMGTVSDTYTDSSSEIDIEEGGVYQDVTPSSPMESSVPQLHAEGHLTCRIHQSIGNFKDVSTKVPSMSNHFHPNLFYTPAFHPLHSQSWQRSSRISYLRSSPPSFLVSSFKRNFNFRETYSHYDFHRTLHSSSNPITVRDDNYSTFVQLRSSRIDEDIAQQSSNLQAFEEIQNFEPTKSDNDPPTKTSSDNLRDEDEVMQSLPSPPHIFRLVDVISSDWEKRKELMKLRSSKMKRGRVS